MDFLEAALDACTQQAGHEPLSSHREEIVDLEVAIYLHLLELKGVSELPLLTRRELHLLGDLYRGRFTWLRGPLVEWYAHGDFSPALRSLEILQDQKQAAENLRRLVT